MKISCYIPGDTDTNSWVIGLRNALPQAEVHRWEAGSQAADYAVVWQPTQAFFDGQPRLKAIFNAGAGVDSLIGLRLPSGIPVVRLEDAGMAAQMSEYVAHAVLRHFRQFDRYSIQAKAQQWKAHEPRRKADFSIGILGFGVLGQAVGQTLQALGFPVHAWTRMPRAQAQFQVFSGQDTLPAFLAATRILVCLLPLTPATQGIINRATLSRLQRDSYLINVARGAHVSEEDLMWALDNGLLAGATLDVCMQEPLPEQHPFWRYPNIDLTPHIAAATLHDEAIAQIAAKIQALEQSQHISGSVHPERGY